jgi:hypothetical protein
MIIRSAATRQHYMQIYQAIKYLSLDVADFLEKGPQLAELPGPDHGVGHPIAFWSSPWLAAVD